MATLFDWKPEYAVAVGRFDHAHQKLLSLLNDLNDSMRTGQGRFVAGRVLNELVNYTQTQFAVEEWVMRSTAYSELLGRIAEHEALTAEVEAFVAEHESGNTDLLSVDLLHFLRSLLEAQTLGTDAMCSSLFDDAGIN